MRGHQFPVHKIYQCSLLLKFLHGAQKVDYPLELDVYDFCSDDLRKRLEVPRQV